MPVLLGIASGLCFGTADFFGGLESRRLPALAVAFWSQVAGAVALGLVLVFIGGAPTLGALGWGAVAGVCGGSALVLFYRGLAMGLMSVVAPISASGAIVPVLWSLARGETPSPLAGIGIVAVVGGIIIASLQGGDAPETAGEFRTSVLLALGAALGFGLFFTFLDAGNAAGDASPLWPVGGARLGSLAVLGALVLSRGGGAWPGARWPRVALVGMLDTTANGLYTYAAAFGNLAVASVLGSLYPVATVLLGRLVLAERLTRLQGAGVALALLGVGLLAAG